MIYISNVKRPETKEAALTEMTRSATIGLAHFLHSGIEQRLESARVARVAYALLAAGCSMKGSFPGNRVAALLVATQRDDGGWSDVEETLWYLGYLRILGRRYNRELEQGRRWLASVRLPCRAWGKSSRDQPRVPITALAATLAPATISKAGLSWLAKQWEADLGSSTQLTYKGAFFLLAHAHRHASFSKKLVSRTIAYLSREQEQDGSFGPWRGHPLGGDPWSTGVVLWGLSTVGALASEQTIERALSWLKLKQLPNGLWPYHYLDDGTAMALLGISSVLSVPRDQ
jgi:hypothetical protein